MPKKVSDLRKEISEGLRLIEELRSCGEGELLSTECGTTVQVSVVMEALTFMCNGKSAIIRRSKSKKMRDKYD